MGDSERSGLLATLNLKRRPVAKKAPTDPAQLEKDRLEKLAAGIRTDAAMTAAPANANAAEILEAGVAAARAAVVKALGNRDTRTQANIDSASKLLENVRRAVTRATDTATKRLAYDTRLQSFLSDYTAMKEILYTPGIPADARDAFWDAESEVSTAVAAKDWVTAKTKLDGLEQATTTIKTIHTAGLAYFTAYARIEADFWEAQKSESVKINKLKLLQTKFFEAWKAVNTPATAKPPDWAKAEAAVSGLGAASVALKDAAAVIAGEKPAFDVEFGTIVKLPEAQAIAKTPPKTLVDTAVKTFRDAYQKVNDARNNGEFTIAKVPSNRGDEAVGFIDGLARFGPIVNLGAIIHGTTVGTNALLERKGAKIGIITTTGFRDTLEMRRRDRPHTWGLWGDFEPVASREMRHEVSERTLADGSIRTPVDVDAVRAACRKLLADGAEALAIVFINAYANPANERAAYAAAREIWPNEHVAHSAQILPEIREFERTSTTALNAYLQPVVASYLGKLENGLAAAEFAGSFHIVQSNGGVMSTATARKFPVRTALSGPAAGVIAAAEIACAAGFVDIITADLGGTSFDVSLVAGGQASLAAQTTIDFGLAGC